MKRTLMTVTAMVVMLALAGTAQAAVGDVLDSTGWTVREGVKSAWPSNTGIKAINGDGLSGLLHDPAIFDNWGPVWFTQVAGASQNTTVLPTPGGVWLMVNMQAVKTVGTIQVWNFGDPVGYPDYNLGAKNVDIYYAGAGATLPTDGVALTGGNALDGTWTTLMNVDLNRAPTHQAASLMSDSLDVTDFEAQYVLIAINSRQGTNTRSEGSVSMAEIRFLEGAIPEPATMSLLALGALGVLARKRRK